VIYLVAPSLAGFAAGRVVDDAGKAAFRPAWGALMGEASSFDRRRRARLAATSPEDVRPAGRLRPASSAARLSRLRRTHARG
jgi:hypothetical protein